MGGGEWAVADLVADVVTESTPVVNGAVLDAAAASSFRTAAVRLARQQPETDGATEAARDAAQALLSLAASLDEVALRQFLRPDPREAEATWTVACYQIGDLTPCALLDFASPVAAVASLAGCGEPSHVAAELVASNPTGTRWTALTRTGRAVSFQLPNGRSASDATQGGLGELSLAAEHWRAQLSRWAARGNEDARSPSVTAPPVVTPRPPVASTPTDAPPLEVEGRAGSTPSERVSKRPPRVAERPGASGGDLERALELVVATLRSVEAHAGASDQPNFEVLSRLDALDRRMSEFQATFEAALDRRIHALASYTAELTRAFVAQGNATTARLDARLDELMARFPGPIPGPIPGPVPGPVGPPGTELTTGAAAGPLDAHDRDLT